MSMGMFEAAMFEMASGMFNDRPEMQLRLKKHWSVLWRKFTESKRLPESDGAAFLLKAAEEIVSGENN